MKHQIFNIKHLTAVVTLLLYSSASLFLTSCRRDDKQDFSKAIIGKWKLVEYNGHAVETNNRTIFTFNADHTGTQTEASIDSASLVKDKTWRRMTPLAVSIDKDRLQTMWQNTSDARKWVATVLSVENGRMSTDYSTLFVNQAPTIVNPATYVSVTDIAHYAEDIVGTWEGTAGSGGAHGDIDHHWVYFADGTYEYRSPDGKGNYVADSANSMNEYILDGDFFATRWINDGVEYREAHDVVIYGNDMTWRGLRANGKRDSFFLHRITPVKSDIEAVLPGKWIVVMEDGDSVLTNRKSVHTFDGAGSVYYTVANAGNDLTQPWENQTRLTYVLFGNDLTEEGYSTTGDPIQYRSQILKVDQNSVEVIAHNGEHVGDIILTRDTSDDYRSKLIEPYWEGVYTTGENSYGSAEGIAWKYHNDGTYDYYIWSEDSAAYLPQAGDHYYMVDGSYFACRWASADDPEHKAMDYEWWDLSFSEGASPEYMYWDGLRYSQETGKKYHNTFVIKRATSIVIKEVKQ